MEEGGGGRNNYLPEMMKKVGYKTAAIGSWHSEVEQMAEESARQMGFDYSGGEVDMNLPDCLYMRQ